MAVADEVEAGYAVPGGRLQVVQRRCTLGIWYGGPEEMNALVDESKGEHWPLGHIWAGDKIRMQRTLAEIFQDAKPSTIAKCDFLLHGTLKSVLIEAIVDGRFRYVYNTVGRLIGDNHTAGKHHQ